MVSIMDKLERLYKRHGFEVIVGKKSLSVFNKRGWFSHRERTTVEKLADKYDADVKVAGHFQVYKKGRSPGNHPTKRTWINRLRRRKVR